VSCRKENRDRVGAATATARPAIVSKRAGRGYLGYLRGQKERLLGTRGQKRVNRPELVEAHGFDTKYAMHALADAADAGAGALMRDGGPARPAFLRGGGRGDRRRRAPARSRARTDSASDSPDDDAVNAFLVDAYRQAWVPGSLSDSRARAGTAATEGVSSFADASFHPRPLRDSQERSGLRGSVHPLWEPRVRRERR